MTEIKKSRIPTFIGRTQKFMDEGLTIPEIAEKLKVSVENVEEWVQIIKQAEENRKKLGL